MSKVKFTDKVIESNINDLMKNIRADQLPLKEQTELKKKLVNSFSQAIAATVVNELEDRNEFQSLLQLLQSNPNLENLIKAIAKVPNLDKLAIKAIDEYKLLFIKSFAKNLDKI